jgi:hypothetical protein
MYCRKKRVSGWAARLANKEKNSDFAFFVTLTYSPENLMFCPKNRPTLYPNHLTIFWKALRKDFPAKSISYYVCGEYGSNKQRPHYHAIIFFNNEKIQPQYAFKQLEKHWKYGEIHIGNVSSDSIAYTLKYISKRPSVPAYHGDTRTKEFSRMSKGIGADYLSSNKIKWHLDDLLERAYIPLEGGNKSPLPRYYKDKIYTKEHKEIIGKHLEETAGTRNTIQTINQRKVNERKVNV